MGVAARDKGHPDHPVGKLVEKLTRAWSHGIDHFCLKLIKPGRDFFPYLCIGIILGENLVEGSAFDSLGHIVDASRKFAVDAFPNPGILLFAVDEHSVEIKQKAHHGHRSYHIKGGYNEDNTKFSCKIKQK